MHAQKYLHALYVSIRSYIATHMIVHTVCMYIDVPFYKILLDYK